MNNGPEPLAYSVAKAAHVLGGISKPTLYRLMHQDGFPSFKIGSRTMISAPGLEAWVKAQAEGGVLNGTEADVLSPCHGD